MQIFNIGMMRSINEPLPITGRGLNLGAGNKSLPGFTPLQLPEWDAETMPIPYPDESFEHVAAFHFLEHLKPKTVPLVMLEAQRVLVKGGVLSIVVPHRLGGMAWQDLDHKSFFTENTWRLLWENHYYSRPTDKKFKMQLHFNLIMGQDERCLALVSQFTKL